MPIGLFALALRVSAEPARRSSEPPAAGSATVPQRSPPSGSESRAASIAAAVADLDAWVRSNGGRLGAAVVDLERGRLLATASDHAPLNPASNQKVLTAAVALAELGADYRFTTGLYGKVTDGVVRELVLRGQGDPSLEYDDLVSLGRTLARAGVVRVDGDLVVDQSRFDDRFVPPAFEQQPNEWASFRAPVSAVALERNTISIEVVPTRAAEPARIVFDPPGFALPSGAVRTVAAGGGQAINIALAPRDGRLSVNVSGHIAERLAPARYVRRVDDPRLFAGFVMKQILKDLSIEVKGSVRTGTGGGEPLAVARSKPLAVLVHELGKHSDNFYAEMLLKAIGAERAGAPGTSEKGAQVVIDWLSRAGALDPGTVIKNGSGLFDANRVSAAALVRTLALVYRDPRISSEYLAQLAIGGVDGTLHSRFRSLRERRIVRAKTGTLSRVVALSGYVLGDQGRPARAFSLIVNDLSGKQTEARRRIDAVVERIAASP